MLLFEISRHSRAGEENYIYDSIYFYTIYFIITLSSSMKTKWKENFIANIGEKHSGLVLLLLKENKQVAILIILLADFK